MANVVVSTNVVIIFIEVLGNTVIFAKGSQNERVINTFYSRASACFVSGDLGGRSVFSLRRAHTRYAQYTPRVYFLHFSGLVIRNRSLRAGGM